MNLNLFLGQGMDGRNVYWANAENAHISILGQSGTGKTYLISRLAKEACRQGFNVVIPDYSDSFLQMQDSCVLHTDIRKINLDILSNSKGRILPEDYRPPLHQIQHRYIYFFAGILLPDNC